jgi:starch synthase
VLDIDDPTGNGTGIVFEPMTGEAIYGAVERAVQLWQDDKVRLDQIRMRGMTIDFSWNQSAREYERIYNGSKRG